jgi:multidrug efflux pump subunit AcrB
MSNVAQAPDVSATILHRLKPLLAELPQGYRIEVAGVAEESAKANLALAKVFPAMIVLMLTVIMFQV